jgi:hypothetical protein
MRTFTDPVRRDEWRVVAEWDASGGLHFVFAREAIRLHAPEGSLATTDDLSEERLRQLFLTSHREIWHENEGWQVRWEVQSDLQTWTCFQSASGEKRVVKAQIMFPFISASELALRVAAATWSRWRDRRCSLVLRAHEEGPYALRGT